MAGYLQIRCVFTSILFVVVVSGSLVAQLNFGVSVDVGASRLYGVEQGRSNFGHGNAEFVIRNKGYVYPSLILRKALPNKFQIETGVGYMTFATDIDLDYFNDFINETIDETLEYRLGYVAVPIRIKNNHDLGQGSRTRGQLGLGVDFCVLVNESSNFEEIVIEEPYIDTREYHPLLNSVFFFGVGIERSLSGGEQLGLGLNVRYFGNWVTENTFGFYKNLEPSSYYYFSVGSSYLF